MCGICGVIQVQGEPRAVLPPGVLDRMTDAMTHRGPNDRGTYTAPGVAFGVRRLSVVDVDGGHQPFANEDRSIWAVQNGELYNHGVLREGLSGDGHTFASRCDTEVLPHLYERFGPDFPRRLRGMFGLAVWDERKRRGVLARDRLGIKPLYYARVGELLLFASELKSLLASGLIEPALDHEAIIAYLTLGFVPGPKTALRGVEKLMPGELLVIADGRVSSERYWRYPEPHTRHDLSFEESAETLLAELETSVRLRLMADVPLGAMLSGGLDSSLIVALMARNMSEPLKTFSVGFRESGRNNELADAREVASALGAEHHELELSFAEQTVDLEQLVWHLDEPLADLSALGFLALSELAAGHVTVALSGQGADELLGGYTKHRAAALCGHWLGAPAPLRKVVATGARIAPAKLRRPALALASTDPVERALSMSGKLASAGSLLRPELASVGDGPVRAMLRERLGGVPDDPLSAALYLDGQLGLVDDMLHYFDRASMAHSLEVRVPFLDHHVVEHCATIPGRYKVRGLQTKAVLKHAARGLVPDRIIDKRKIGFFNGAVDGWFRAQTSGAISDYLLGDNPRYAELLDPREVQRLVSAQTSGRRTADAHLLLSILMLEIWLSTYLPRALAQPEPVRERVLIVL
jgi:asparagine synthase (glutamine-hydrolysing)